LPDSNIVVFGANDFSDDADVTARPRRKKSKPQHSSPTSRPRVSDYVVHVEHGIARYMGLKEIVQDAVTIEFMVLELQSRRGCMCLSRVDLIQKYRSLTLDLLRC